MVGIWDFVTSNVDGVKVDSNTIKLGKDKASVTITCPGNYDWIRYRRQKILRKRVLVEWEETDTKNVTLIHNKSKTHTNRKNYDDGGVYIVASTILITLIAYKLKDQEVADVETGEITVVAGEEGTAKTVDPPKDDDEKNKEEQYMRYVQVAIGIVAIVISAIGIYLIYKHYQKKKGEKSE